MKDEDVNWWFDTAREVGLTVTVKSVKKSLGSKFSEARVKNGLESLAANGRAITLAGDDDRANETERVRTKQYLLLDGGALRASGKEPA